MTSFDSGCTALCGIEARHHTQGLLYRQADLDRLARSRRIDWPALYATPKGRPSPFSALLTQRQAAGQ
ncbi:hypothetical protein JCM4814A_80440 [Streptomyces phaeofaciens JCM 4814]|uniref:Uncharacterized protein n=1 Tax=Streptomyces phaeofaciens TaxID=68254 RepID=A0A918HRB0_9ACTN|nr:hypothetical protein [Streptomyces phaeofaciens]GGT91381.1 hypothetical protein GCM10010226_81730 [Streptomyces phaeofaciens]